VRQTQRRHHVEIVDARTLTAHLLTTDAATSLVGSRWSIHRHVRRSHLARCDGGPRGATLSVVLSDARPEIDGDAATVQSRRYVRSPLNGQVHLLDDAPHSGALKARCAAVIPSDVRQFDQPPLGTPCDPCRLAVIAEINGGRRP
jgi:hypothetical protein